MESAYDWYAARNPSAANGFREELRHAVDALAENPAHSPVMEGVQEGTSSRDFPSPWYTGCTGTKSRSSPWLTGDDGQATGDRDSDPPSNFRIQRSALRAAADPARSPAEGHVGGSKANDATI